MTDSRKVIVSIVASVVVVGVVVGLVLAFAVIPLPDYPSLAENPDSTIAGTVAYARWDNGDLCISTVAAGGGESREVLCDRNIAFGEFAPGWTPDGMLVVQDYSPSSDVFRVIDPETGDTVDRVPLDMDKRAVEPYRMDQYAPASDGSTVFAEDNRGSVRLVVRSPNGAERTILEAEGPKNYWFEWSSWSPDGEWILVQDSKGRIIVIAAEGDPNARILVEGVDGWMSTFWYMPGYTEGTWDPRE